jgi:hypothetical protein
VDPTLVVAVGSTATQKTIGAGLLALGSKTHLRVAAGTYAEKVSIAAGETVTIVGDGVVTVAPGLGNQPAVKVGASSTVGLQGLTLTGALGGGDADGVNCQGSSSSTQSKLTVVESTIKSNEGQGVEASYCDVTLRRSKVQNNQGGGVKLSDGTFVLDDNLVTSNGTVSSSTGGVNLASPVAGTRFHNNTVAYNQNGTGTGAGVFCSGNVELHNSIIYGNGASPVLVCTPKYSDVEGITPANGNINADPLFTSKMGGDFSLQSTSPCIDTGLDTVTGVTLSTIDIDGKPRKVDKAGKGTTNTVDMGAYELQ